MEELSENYYEPRYTMRWLGFSTIYVLALAFVLALVAGVISSYAFDRVEAGLLLRAKYSLLSESVSYSFGIISITCISLMLIEVAFRKAINFLQYALIAMALTEFYLLLLALSEKMPFWLSYVIVSVMTITLIALFIKGISHNRKAVALTATILAAEYGLMLFLLELGTMALLVGSISLFAIIALGMYFTLKLKLVNDELTLK